MSWGSTSNGDSAMFDDFGSLMASANTSRRSLRLPSSMKNEFTESMIKALIEDMDVTDDDGPRFKNSVHQHFHRIAYSRWFTTFVLFVVVSNIITISLQTDADISVAYQQWFDLLDAIFLMIYSVEFLLKILATPIAYWKSFFNLFDFFILLLSYAQLFIVTTGWFNMGSDLTFIRLLRAARAFRALRTVSFIKGLQTIVKAVLKTLLAVLNLAFLIVLLNYVCSITAFYVFSTVDTGSATNYFTTFGSSFVVLFGFITAESWTVILRPLEDVYGVDSYAIWGPRLFAVIVIFAGHFICTNMFVGVVLQNLEEATLEAKAKDFLKKQAKFGKKKDVLMRTQNKQLRDIFAQTGSTATIDDVVAKVVGHLRHDDQVPITELSCDVSWLQSFMATLDIQEAAMFQVQQLQFELAGVLCEMAEQRLTQSVEHYHQGF